TWHDLVPLARCDETFPCACGRARPPWRQLRHTISSYLWEPPAPDAWHPSPDSNIRLNRPSSASQRNHTLCGWEGGMMLERVDLDDTLSDDQGVDIVSVMVMLHRLDV